MPVHAGLNKDHNPPDVVTFHEFSKYPNAPHRNTERFQPVLFENPDHCTG